MENKTITIKNQCLKERKVDNPYEIWKTPDGRWEWRVLKKWQVNDEKPHARWMCAVKSPFTYGNFEIGDVYVKEIKEVAEKMVMCKDCGHTHMSWVGDLGENKDEEGWDRLPECEKCDCEVFK